MATRLLRHSTDARFLTVCSHIGLSFAKTGHSPMPCRKQAEKLHKLPEYRRLPCISPRRPMPCSFSDRASNRVAGSGAATEHKRAAVASEIASFGSHSSSEAGGSHVKPRR
jgi:hypothetical protein